MKVLIKSYYCWLFCINQIKYSGFFVILKVSLENYFELLKIWIKLLRIVKNLINFHIQYEIFLNIIHSSCSFEDPFSFYSDLCVNNCFKNRHFSLNISCCWCCFCFSIANGRILEKYSSSRLFSRIYSLHQRDSVCFCFHS